MEGEGRTVRVVLIVVAIGVLAGIAAFYARGVKGDDNLGVDLWSFDSYLDDQLDEIKTDWDRVEEFEKQLVGVVLEELHFDEVPLSECLDSIARQVRELDPENEIEFEFASSDIGSRRVSVELYHIPLVEALRELVQATSCNYRIEPYNKVYIGELGMPVEPTSEGWFLLKKEWVKASGKGPVDVKQSLEELGIIFPYGSTTIYYPDAGLLWASNEVSQLELIEYLCAIDPPGWRDRLHDWHLYRSPWSRWVRPYDTFGGGP